MNIKKFKVKVLVEKTMDIEVNLDLIDEKFFEAFSDCITPVDSVEEVIEHIAYNVSQNDSVFVEGVGFVRASHGAEDPLTISGVKVEYNEWNDDVEVEIE